MASLLGGGSASHKDEIIGRMGEEFVLVKSNIKDSGELKEFAKRILSVFNKPLHINNRSFHITSSVGFSFFPNDGEDAETLMKNADAAMNMVKQSGKNKYLTYSNEIGDTILRKIELENKLRNAIQNDELEIYYQPQVETSTGVIVGLEALLRWNTPDKGMIMPNDFIPIAEETGLIISIGEWVLRKVCSQNKSWQEKGLPKITVAVNISASQFHEDNFTDLVKKYTKRNRVRAKMVGA